MDLIGSTVRLRGLVEEDAQEISRLVSHPRVGRYVGEWAWLPNSPVTAKQFIDQVHAGGNGIHWAIEVKTSGVFLGVTGLSGISSINRNASWGIWIGPSTMWGQGYGSETCRLVVSFAFRALGLEKVYLHVHEGNDAAHHVYENAGFVVEGTLKRHTWIDGAFRDTDVMAVYRDHPLYATPHFYEVDE